MSNDIIFSDATRLAELIRTKEVSPVEVVQAHLDRIEAVDPKINAIVTRRGRRARGREGGGGGGPGGRRTRPAARRAVHGEGLDRHRGRADPARLADLQGPRPRRRRDQRRAHEEGRRHPAGEDQPARILLLDRERQPALRPVEQPVGPDPHAGRVERRRVGGHRGGHVAARSRHRPRHLRARPGRADRHRLAEGDPRPRAR